MLLQTEHGKVDSHTEMGVKISSRTEQRGAGQEWGEKGDEGTENGGKQTKRKVHYVSIRRESYQ